MKKIRQGLICLAVFAAVMTVLYLLLVLSAVIPNEAVADHMRETARHFFVAERYAFSDSGRLRDVTDNYADQIWMNISWHMGEGNPFESVLRSQYNDGNEFGTAAGLVLSVTNGAPANAEYTRYWHGMAMFIRLLHTCMDIQGIRIFLLVWLILLAVVTMAILLKKGHGDICASLLVALTLVQWWNLRLSVEYIGCFLICVALCPFFLLLENRGDFPLMVLCVVSGAMTAFFDFLTTETVPLLLPLILVVAVRAKERRLGTGKETALALLRCILCWGAAYAGAFLVKWIAVSLVTGENHFSTALRSAGKRLGSAVPEELPEGLSRFTMGAAANLSVLFGSAERLEYRRIGEGLSWSALLLLYVVSRFPRRKSWRKGTLALLSLGAMVFVRYFVLANHSYTHSFFTYRALVSTAMALLTAVHLNLPQVKKRKEPV